MCANTILPGGLRLAIVFTLRIRTNVGNILKSVACSVYTVHSAYIYQKYKSKMNKTFVAGLIFPFSYFDDEYPLPL